MNRDAKHKLYTSVAFVQRYIDKIRLGDDKPVRLVISNSVTHDEEIATPYNLYERIMDALEIEKTIGHEKFVDEFSPPIRKRKKKK